MKIAITYDKENNSVFQHFGHTEFFYVYDTNSKVEEVIGNGGNSHVDLISYLQSKGIEVLICGGVGNRAIEILSSCNIKVIPGVNGKINDVINKFNSGELKGDETQIHSCSCH